jgi:hypothetical protein
MPLLITIGLDEHLAERVRGALDARVVSYPDVPSAWTCDGQVLIESARVFGRWLEPDGVVYYSYFENADLTRRALALAETPSFPDVRTTLPHDDRVMSLLLASRADGSAPPRGFAPPGQELRFDGERVFKWSNRHCGDDKARGDRSFVPTEPTLIEPYLPGTSERILVVGERVWHLRYDSADWRKNVGGTIEVLPTPDPALAARGKQTAQRLGLRVVGIDYQITDAGPVLVEVNAYPGITSVPGAEDAFLTEVVSWWSALVAEKGL